MATESPTPAILALIADGISAPVLDLRLDREVPEAARISFELEPGS